MKQSQSNNHQTPSQIQNYSLVLNDRSRKRQFTVLKQNKQENDLQSEKLRRKSCYCDCCGLMNNFQFKLMNIPFKKAFNDEKQQSQPKIQSDSTQQSQRMSLFYRFSSIKPVEKDQMRMSLEIHGFGDKLKRQSTLQRIILKSTERQKRSSNNNQSLMNSFISSNDNASCKSLDLVLESRNNTQQSPTLTSSPLKEISTPKITSARKIHRTNVYFSSSTKQLKTTSSFCPIKKPPQLILPKIKLKGQE